MKRHQLILQGSFWSFVFLFWLVIFWEDDLAISFTMASVFTLFLYIDVLVIHGWFIKNLLYKNRTMLFVFSFLLLNLAIGTILSKAIYIVYDLLWIPGKLVLSSRQILYKGYMIPLLFSGTACSFRFWSDKLVYEKRLADTQKEKVEAELNFLKAQIDPHFLFNSLNSIYASIDKTNVDAKAMLVKFTDLLRYNLYETGSDKVNIEREFEYLRNYVEIQKARNEKRLAVTLNLNASVESLQIPPLLFIPIIENAFKFVCKNPSKENSITISWETDENEIRFACHNTTENSFPEKQDGIGLKNVRRRIELLYPGCAEVRATHQDEYYVVKINIRYGK